MQHFPDLDVARFAPTREALHAYSRVLGDLLKARRARRKHWWHASLRPSLCGLTTGVLHDSIDYEIELDLIQSVLIARTADGETTTIALTGQPPAELAARLCEITTIPGLRAAVPKDSSSKVFQGYDGKEAQKLGKAIRAVADVMTSFRSEIREETSPIQLWPHHFDLSMLWLPGTRVAGVDPGDEENADQQMNFGFVFGDGGIPDPYFYVTAYPFPKSLADTELPKGARWVTEEFSGAVLPYHELVSAENPGNLLQDLWTRLYAAGRTYLLSEG